MDITKEKKKGLIEFVGRTRVNNGIKGYVNELNIKPNPKNIISVSQIGTIVAQIRKQEWYASQNIFSLKAKNDESNLISLYGVTAINKSLKNSFSDGYGNYPTLAKLIKIIIKLPVKNNKPDFEFMDSFITALKAERMTKLQAYLSAMGLKNYTLTNEEEKVISEYNNLNWDEFRLGTLFERVKTKKLPFKADELPKEQTANYTLPCLTSSFKNQGLNYFAPKDGATILKNMISIPSNSDVYRAYFQSNEFTVLSDAYAIRWIFSDVELLPNQYLFTVPCINKVTDLSIYSYKNKLGGWNVVKDKLIQLPIKNDQPDYAIMDTLISAIKKLVIKDVVLYTQAKTLSSDSDYANNDSYKDSDQLCLL